MQATGRVVGEVRAAQILPDLPDDCRRLTFSGVREGDRLDVAVLKADAALARQNAQAVRCADWYDQLKAGLRGSAPQ